MESASTKFNQTEFFKQLAATSVRFVWGRSLQQVWKTAESPQDTHWGLHEADMTPKAIIPELQSVFVGSY